MQLSLTLLEHAILSFLAHSAGKALHRNPGVSLDVHFPDAYELNRCPLT